MERSKIKDYYSHEIESARLEQEGSKLEGLRTKEIIERYTQKASLDILDVGGGAGFYSFWLHQKGHHVSLVDLSPKNIELVKNHSAASGITLNRIEIGDAVDLKFSNDQFDIVLMLGPLYHLVNKNERIAAISEAKRVLKQGGVLIAAIISRYASLFDGFYRDLVFDDQFFKLMTDDLNSGIHLNETKNLEYFTTAYFHTPHEIQSEIVESGLKLEKLIAIESFGWIVRDFSVKLKNAAYLEKLLNTIRMIETNEELMAISPHIIAVGRKE